LTARAANSAIINRESSDCGIIRTFTHLLSALLVVIFAQSFVERDFVAI
jgi:hypothetical protein